MRIKSLLLGATALIGSILGAAFATTAGRYNGDPLLRRSSWGGAKPWRRDHLYTGGCDAGERGARRAAKRLAFKAEHGYFP